MKFVSYALAILFATCAVASAQTGVNGTWRVEGDGRPFPWEVVLRASGSEVTGVVSSCASIQGAFEIIEGTVDRNTITFKCRSGNGQRLLTLVGVIAGDEIAFIWSMQVLGGDPAAADGLFGGGNSPRFTVKRVPDGDLAARADQLANEVRGVELAASINISQEDVKIEGRVFLPRKVRRVRSLIVCIGWGLGESFYQDPQVRKLLEATESGLLLVRISRMVAVTGGGGVVNNAALGGANGLLMLLQRLAQESGHRELTDTPLLFWGHSAAGGFGPTFAMMYPQRTIGFMDYHSAGRGSDMGVLSKIPALFLAGEKDTSVPLERIQDSWKSGRAAGAPWAFAIEPDTVHMNSQDLTTANALVIPWITAVLNQRLSSDGATLRAVDDSSNWMGDNRTREVAPSATFSGSKSEASWLPDELSSRGWQMLINHKADTGFTPVARDPRNPIVGVWRGRVHMKKAQALTRMVSRSS